MVAEVPAIDDWFPVKTLRVALLALFLGLPGLASADAGAAWLTDFNKAQEEAKAGQKMILIDFTGSDWCGWCRLLEAEVFSQPEFEEFAKSNLVLLRADFPRGKELSDDLRKQNYTLAQRFEVGGFPTIVVLNSEGRQIGLLGYMRGGASAFIDELKKLPKS